MFGIKMRAKNKEGLLSLFFYRGKDTKLVIKEYG